MYRIERDYFLHFNFRAACFFQRHFAPFHRCFTGEAENWGANPVRKDFQTWILPVVLVSTRCWTLKFSWLPVLGGAISYQCYRCYASIASNKVVAWAAVRGSEFMAHMFSV